MTPGSPVVDDLAVVAIGGQVRVHGFDCADARKDARRAGREWPDFYRPDGETFMQDLAAEYTGGDWEAFLSKAVFLPCSTACIGA